MNMQEKSEHLSWVNKYSPRKISDVLGHDKVALLVVNYIKNYKKQKKKALLLYGQSGNGKTSLIHAIANELGYELVEVNASDDRNKEMLNLKVGNAINQQSLFFSDCKIILIDEIDGISGFYDRGATTEIVNMIKKSKFPVIMTANDPWDKKFSAIRSACEMVELPTLHYNSIANILEKICEHEKIKCDKETLQSIARHAGGDARGAINDLQAISAHKKSISKDDLEMVGQRRQTESVLQSLTKIFKTTDSKVAITAFDDCDIDTDEQFLWIEQNIPIEYEKAEDIYRAFNSLSKADVFRGRITRYQHWHFLTTINFLLTCGIALAKEDKYKKFVLYKRNERILSMWIMNNANAKKKSISEKIAIKTHTSKKGVFKDSVLYYRMTAKHNKDFLHQLTEEYNLDEDEVAWLSK
jgi:replication factor C large subunit